MRVLVTGASGFLGGYVILRLLTEGYEVRGTLRDLRREEEVRATFTAAGARSDAPISFVRADLEHDEGWDAAVAGCEYVVHVASPFPSATPQNEDDLIRPAHDGALRVLKSAKNAGVRRVVLTSSFAAIGYGQRTRNTPFDESDWTNVSGADVQPYIKSKVVAERAAWDYIARDGGSLQLCVINPVGIFGPVLGADYSSSIDLVARMLNGSMPFCPRVCFGVADVRDVAEIHVRAMTSPDADGQRYIVSSGEVLSLIQVARILREQLGKVADKAPRYELPDWLARLLACVNPQLRGTLPQLGIVRRANNEKARRTFDWVPRSAESTLSDTARSLIAMGADAPA